MRATVSFFEVQKNIIYSIVFNGVLSASKIVL